MITRIGSVVACMIASAAIYSSFDLRTFAAFAASVFFYANIEFTAYTEKKKQESDRLKAEQEAQKKKGPFAFGA